MAIFNSFLLTFTGPGISHSNQLSFQQNQPLGSTIRDRFCHGQRAMARLKWATAEDAGRPKLRTLPGRASAESDV